MIDLHTHILPNIDDGAKDVTASIKLLKQCAEQKIRRVALTSHFDCEKESLECFLERRELSYEMLKKRLKNQNGGFQFKLGAEVFFSTQLLNMDIKNLCMEGTDVLLMELPVGYRPQFFRETLYELQLVGILPVIAHVERYPYILENPQILAEWIDAGVYIQVNAGSILQQNQRAKMIMKLIKWGMVHVIASDAHSYNSRPQLLRQAFVEIEKQLDAQSVYQLKDNAQRLFEGNELEKVNYHNPRKILGHWV